MKTPISHTEFHWAGGIENTFIPQERPGLRALEEYTLTQHYDQWRADLTRAASLGISKLRWGVPWYRVEPEPGKFDWSWIDEVLDFMVNSLHIEPILDLMHYGTPLWLEMSFADRRYPDLVARYARQFATRYKHLVRFYTPLNEPGVTADFCGRRGLWPPYLSGDRGFVTVMIACARGIQKTVRAIQSVQPDAYFVAVEAMSLHRPVGECTERIAQVEFAKDLLCWDLVAGKVDDKHPLNSWLIHNGASPVDLAALADNAVEQDILGVNFYPWSVRDIKYNHQGAVEFTPGPDHGRQLAELLRACYAHSGKPLFLTETSFPNDLTGRRLWMAETIDAVRTVRGEGLPVIGYTWFPIFTMIDWAYRTSDKPLADFLLHLGLWDAQFDQKGQLVRHETRLVADYRDWISRGMPAPACSHSGRQAHDTTGPASSLKATLAWLYHHGRRLLKRQ